jgi:hypothetical protein
LLFEDEIRECFIEAGDTGTGDYNNNDQEENRDEIQAYLLSAKR